VPHRLPCVRCGEPAESGVRGSFISGR
jgi:hypothetical protein